MSETPETLRYVATHEWVRDDGDGLVTVGITDHAQEQLGDVVYVELPDPGAAFNAEQECAVVESVKAASDIYAPVGGEVVAVNDALTDTPETLNSDPYGDGWLMQLRIGDPLEMDRLLSAADYLATLDE
ncbi:MAG: glycine cleavage system protein GcvH [Pseudomonadota bacterium]